MSQSDLPPGDGPLHATFETSMGTIVVRLYEKEAPRTVATFVGLATGKKEWRPCVYESLFRHGNPGTGERQVGRPLHDGTSFHRVIPNFMIQGGDPYSNVTDGDPALVGCGNPGFLFEDEFQSGLRFDRPGLLAMAGSGPNTNGSQYFITEVATPHLNNTHTIFGEVVRGFEIVPKIARVAATSSKPTTPVVIQRVTIERVAS